MQGSDADVGHNEARAVAQGHSAGQALDAIALLASEDGAASGQQTHIILGEEGKNRPDVERCLITGEVAVPRGHGDLEVDLAECAGADRWTCEEGQNGEEHASELALWNQTERIEFELELS